MMKNKLIIGALLGILFLTGGCGAGPTSAGNSSSGAVTANAGTGAGSNTGTGAASSQAAPVEGGNATGAAASGAQGNAEQGKQVFATNCASCHAVDDKQIVGPGLKGIYKKDQLPNGQSLNDANLGQWIKMGDNQMPGNPALSDSDLANVLAYLKTLN